MRNLKKVIALVAVFAMLVSSVAFAGAFSDVAETDNYARAIEVLNDLGIIKGDDEDADGVMDFRPEDTITRAEVTAIIARIQGLDVAGQTTTDFVDVPATHWASGYVAQAAKQGIVNGYGDGNFGPEDNVTYEQMLKMLMETLGYRPFANDNGGYPTGYVTAATRYGVLDDVLGGGIGVEAPRGMVAQMVYNAINAPIMDVVTYGNDKEYAVFDGSNNNLAYITLLSRDLKMVRLTGLVTENSYSGDIDTEARKTIGFVPFITVENAAYLGMDVDDENFDIGDYTQVLYQGEFDADGFLGYAVEMYAKKEDLFENIRTIKSIVKAGINDEVTFSLDQYVEKSDGINGAVALKFSKNETSNATVSKTVQKNPTIIYNGVKSEEGLAAFFGGFITKNNNLSGQVTLMDADTVAGYEVVIIEAAVSAVVREVSANGQVRFFRPVQDPKDGTGIALVFDADDTQSVIKLTKNGEEIDYTELKKWDVLSILWNGEKEYYDVKVLDADNYVDAIVSVVKSNSVVLSNGESYKVADNAYQFALASAQPGMSGRFYIDAYGKIVALDDTVAVEGATTITDNYAYVLAAEPVDGNWSTDRQVIQVKLLDKSGEIYEAKLASKVKFINLDVNDAIKGLFTSAFQADVTKSTVADMTKATTITAANLDDLATALVNTVIAYEGNSAGEIKTIVLGQTGDDERAMEILHITDGGKTNDYNKDGLNFDDGDIFVNEDTVVFFVKGENSIDYADDSEAATADLCSVGTIASLVDNAAYDVVAIGRDANDEAEVIVLLDEDGAYDQGANIAVIDSVGQSVVNGADSVFTVSFYLNGEKKTATTKVDMPAGYDFETAQQGDIVKLALDGDTITMATEILTFTRADGNFYTAAYGDGLAATAPEFDLKTESEGEDEDFYFGAVTDFRTNGAAQVALMAEDGTATGVVKSVKEADGTDVYVYDVDNKDEYRLSLGSIGDANADTDLNDAGSYVVLKKDPEAVFAQTGLDNAIGMMDYVFVRYYNNAAADIVVYKNYDFGKYTIEDTDPTPAPTPTPAP